LSLSKQQYFVSDTTSQSTTRQDMLEIFWGGMATLAPQLCLCCPILEKILPTSMPVQRCTEHMVHFRGFFFYFKSRTRGTQFYKKSFENNPHL